MWRDRVALAVLLGAISSGSASSAVFYDNGSFDGGNAFHSDFDAPVFPVDTVEVADDFELISSQILRSIVWSGVYFFTGVPEGPDNFTIRIFDASGGLPGALVHAFTPGAVLRIPTGALVADFVPAFEYRVAVDETVLAPGQYYLSIVNDTEGSDENWFWATSDAVSGNHRIRTSIGGAWMSTASFPEPTELAFALSDSAEVPLPASLLLLLSGLAVGAVTARARRRR